MPAFSIRQLDHLVLRVQDLPRSIAFYRQVMGCELVRLREDLGLAHLRAGASMIDLVSLDGRLGRDGGAGPGAEGRNLDHLCLRIEPFDEAALCRHLQHCGIAPEGPAARRFGAEGEGWSLYLRDPDGNIVELKGPAIDGSAAGTGEPT